MSPFEFEAVKWLLVALFGVAGTLFKMQLNRVDKDLQEHKENHQELRDDLTDVKLHYVHKEDFLSYKQELWHRFDRLEERLLNHMNKEERDISNILKHQQDNIK